ncbi:hypothetical protein LEP1GSC017_1869 [Leptospira meyeri serovar Hardjo str. Went 5]|nr:hypothetical protein LEP1GSC017_1869 [Leptospira meyeri serovar Hardjo str. Went 5]
MTGMLQFDYRPRDRVKFVRFFSKNSVCHNSLGNLLQKDHDFVLARIEILIWLLGGSAWRGPGSPLQSFLRKGFPLRSLPLLFPTIETGRKSLSICPPC